MPVPDDIKDILKSKNEAHWRNRLANQGDLKAPAPRSTWRRFMDSMEEGMRRGPASLITSVVAPLVETGDGTDYSQRRAALAARENQRRKDYDAVNAPEDVGDFITDFAGGVAGSVISDPTNLVGGGAKTLGRKALNAAGIGAVADTALQGGEIAAGIRDEYDPVQGAVNVAAGPAFIGGIEFAKKIGNKFGQVTSTFRSKARNKKVGGAENSHHLRGNAIDIARAKGVSHKQLENAYKRAGYNIVESIDEGDHSHFAFNFKGGKKKGGVIEDFDFRPPELRGIDELKRLAQLGREGSERAAELASRQDLGPDFKLPTIEQLDERINNRLNQRQINDIIKQAEGMPILDSSHEKFTPYVERPTSPANDPDNISDISDRYLSPELRDYSKKQKAEIDKRVEEHKQIGDQYHQEGKLPFNRGELFTTPKSGESPWKVLDYYVDRKRPDRYGYFVERHTEDGAERSTLLVSDPEADARMLKHTPDWDRKKHVSQWKKHDGLTPAERQEMDASAVRPDIEPIVPKGLGKGSVATTPVNDYKHLEIHPETGNYRSDVKGWFSDDAPEEFITDVMGVKHRPMSGNWHEAVEFLEKKHGYYDKGQEISGGQLVFDEDGNPTQAFLDAVGGIDRSVPPPEHLPGSRDGSEEYPLPPGPNDPNFPAPGTPGNRGGPKGGDDTPVDPEKKLIDALKKARPISAEQRKLFREERSRRAEELSAIQRQGGSKRNYYAQLKSLKGELPKVDYESFANDFTEEDVSNLLTKITTSNKLLPFEKVKAQGALLKLLGSEGVTVPSAGEIKLLSEIYSRDLIETLLQNRTLMEKAWDGFKNAINLPRSLMASFDLSAPFRQGVFMIGRKEFWKSWGAMFKAFGSKRAYEAVMRSIHDHPNFQLMKKSGVAFSDAHSPFLDDHEEQFMSNWAEKIPVVGKGVEMSNRAYSAFLNKMRADVFNDLVSKAESVGRDFHHDPKAAKDLARFVNAGTGRGSLGKSGDAAAPFLSGLFFSPRLMASRLTMLNPAFYATLDPLVRKEAVKSLLTFSGLATTVLGVAASAGLDVETDPRSSDFAKIKFGNTRYDILGGFQQYIRLGAQLLTGETKTLKGKERDLENFNSRYQAVLRFFRTKFSPVAAYTADALDGKNVIGEKFSPTKDALQSFIPLFAQDLAEILSEEGFSPNLLSGIPAFFGVGVQTYDEKEKKKKSSVPSDVKDLLGAK